MQFSRQDLLFECAVGAFLLRRSSQAQALALSFVMEAEDDEDNQDDVQYNDDDVAVLVGHSLLRRQPSGTWIAEEVRCEAVRRVCSRFFTRAHSS